MNLQSWIDIWSSRYPLDYDEILGAVAGKESLGHDDAESLYHWKFRGLWPKRKIEKMRAEPEERIRDLTRRSFSCEDELGALRIMTLVPGLSAAGASAVLAAQNPQRYTVMDVRALKSLIALGRWDGQRQGHYASERSWIEYLETCRKVSAEVDRSLRVIDRALWKANGDTSCNR